MAVTASPLPAAHVIGTTEACSAEERIIQLSVVVADGGAGRSIDEVLRAIDAGCAGLACEIIVVSDHLPPDRWPTPVSGRELSRIARPTGTLTPVLWGAGASVARGRVIAFTTTQMLVSSSWGSALHDAIRENTAGAAGAIGLASDADAATTAMFFVRFSAFLPEAVRTRAERPRDIPGDNAAYLRSAILRHEDLLAEGFWEVEFHRRFERAGQTLTLIDGAEATMRGPVAFVDAVRQRVEHATEFGAARVARHGEPIWRIVLAAPLIPVLLVMRIGRRVLPFARYRVPFLRSLPWLFALTSAWAFGEAVGAVRARQRASSRAS